MVECRDLGETVTGKTPEKHEVKVLEGWGVSVPESQGAQTRAKWYGQRCRSLYLSHHTSAMLDLGFGFFPLSLRVTLEGCLPHTFWLFLRYCIQLHTVLWVVGPSIVLCYRGGNRGSGK